MCISTETETYIPEVGILYTVQVVCMSVPEWYVNIIKGMDIVPVSQPAVMHINSHIFYFKKPTKAQFIKR